MEVKLIKSFSCRELAKSLRVQGSTQPPGSGFVSARTTGGKQDPDYLTLRQKSSFNFEPYPLFPSYTTPVRTIKPKALTKPPGH
jgi:hypothetical protein